MAEHSSNDDSEASDIESGDSDRELQVALASGLIKPGLNAPVQPQKQFINDVAGMEECLTELENGLSWIERLDVCVDMPASNKGLALEEEVASANLEGDVHNDFKREMTFYQQAQAAVLWAYPRLQTLGVPTLRPADYFAQMAKTDEHMKKVREKLVEKKTSMERSEKAKKLRELRKFGKKVQQDVLQKRQKEKKDMMNQVKKYRKGKETSLEFLNEGKKDTADKPQMGKKREAKNKKFGFGGQKKRSKQNTAVSAGSMKDFDRSKFQGKPGQKKMNGAAKTGAGGGGAKKGGNKNKRPGKSRRKNMKK